MVNGDALTLRVEAAPDGDLQELAELTELLRIELLELDVAGVDLRTGQSVPERAKGLATVAGWLAVRFGADGLRAVLGAVRGWAARTNRVVEVSYGGDVLKLTGVTSEQQEKIIDAWIARHAAGA